MKTGIFYFVVAFVSAAILMGCASAKLTPTAAPPTTQPTSNSTPSTPNEVPTVPQPAATLQLSQAASGMAVFASQCGRCHGAKMGGGSEPALSAQGLAKYGTAKKLFDKISTTMPSGRGGSLSTTQYYDVISYILTEQGLLQSGRPVNADTVDGIKLQP